MCCLQKMKKRVNVVVYGAGAMGTFMAAKLRHRLPSDSIIALITSRPAQRDALLAGGVTISSTITKDTLRIATSDTDRSKLLIGLQQSDSVNLLAVSEFDVAVLMTKGMDATDAAARNAVNVLACGGKLLSLQNGIGYAACIAGIVNLRHNHQSFIVGTTTMGIRQGAVGAAGEVVLHQASVKSPAVIADYSKGETPVVVDDKVITIEDVRTLLEYCDMAVDVKPSDSTASVLWTKLVVSASLNPITVISNNYNGYIFECNDTRLINLLAGAVAEIVAVANALNINLDFSASRRAMDAEPAAAEAVRSVLVYVSSDVNKELQHLKYGVEALAHVLWVAHSTFTNISSMLADVRTNRRTEADSIILPLLRHAQEVGVQTPVLRHMVGVLDDIYSAERPN
jgi:2-dehydropantoate 2-reductase